jgi:hypothetical protein
MHRTVAAMAGLGAVARALPAAPVDLIEAASPEVPDARQLRVQPGPLGLEPGQIKVVDVRHREGPSIL